MRQLAGRLAFPAAVSLFLVIGATAEPVTAQVLVWLGVGVAGAVALEALRLGRWSRSLVSLVPAAAVAVLCHGAPGNVGWFGLCVLAGWCALRSGPAPSLALTGVFVVLLIGEWIVLPHDLGWANWLSGLVFTLAVTLLARRQGALIEQLRQAQAGLAERARTEERNRIAGELHDAIGHALTVSLMHVTGARLALEDGGETAERALAEAERLTRQSLDEVRLTVRMMREAGPAGADGASEGGRPGFAAPAPRAQDVESLVSSFRRAGAEVGLEIVGRADGLPEVLGMTVYRVVQEALTNAARHAPGAPTTVRIEYGSGSTRVLVRNPLSSRHGADGAAADGHGGTSGRGFGLVGMEERVTIVGGRLRAGADRTEWLVDAELPL